MSINKNDKHKIRAGAGDVPSSGLARVKVELKSRLSFDVKVINILL